MKKNSFKNTKFVFMHNFHFFLFCLKTKFGLKNKFALKQICFKQLFKGDGKGLNRLNPFKLSDKGTKLQNYKVSRLQSYNVAKLQS